MARVAVVVIISIYSLDLNDTIGCCAIDARVIKIYVLILCKIEELKLQEIIFLVQTYCRTCCVCAKLRIKSKETVHLEVIPQKVKYTTETILYHTQQWEHHFKFDFTCEVYFK